MSKLIPVNERGLRIGGTHHRARIPDREIDLMLSLLEERQRMVEQCERLGLSHGDADVLLSYTQLSFGWIADKFECSKSQVRRIWLGLQRGQIAARWKRVEEKEAKEVTA